MSDTEIIKKEFERADLDFFIEAYDWTADVQIPNDQIDDSETPDFIWRRSDGSSVGIELTRIRRSPDSAFADKIFHRRDSMDGEGAAEEIHRLVGEKDKKIRSRRDQVASCILVLQLVECSINDVKSYLVKGDFDDTVFAEIWLGDYSDVPPYGDAYRVIELFGLHPDEWWGYHRRERGKPWG